MSDKMKEQVTLNVEVPRESFVLWQSLVKLVLYAREEIDAVTGEFKSEEKILEILRSEVKPAIQNMNLMGSAEITDKKIGVCASAALSALDLVERFK